MAKVERFEDLKIWQDARVICRKIQQISAQTELKNDFGLKNQIRNSSGSVMDNIAEGFERGGNAEFIQFLGFAKGSAGEVRSQVYRLFDSSYISQNKFEELKTDAEELSKQISNFIKYLKNSEYKGFKFKKTDLLNFEL